jgi:hypothetical protein
VSTEGAVKTELWQEWPVEILEYQRIIYAKDSQIHELQYEIYRLSRIIRRLEEGIERTARIILED